MEECTCILEEIADLCPEDGNTKGLKQGVHVIAAKDVESIEFADDPNNPGKKLNCISAINLVDGAVWKYWNIAKDRQVFDFDSADEDDCNDNTKNILFQVFIPRQNKTRSTTIKRAELMKMLLVVCDKNGERQLLGRPDDPIQPKFSGKKVEYNGYIGTWKEQQGCEPPYLDESVTLPT